MSSSLEVKIDAWPNGDAIPDKYGFCVPASEGHVSLGQNLNPRISWAGAPEETASFVIICSDPDVPTVPETVNREDMTVPADQPRSVFYHWVMIDIPPTLNHIDEGADSDGVVARGKGTGETKLGIRGVNNYTDWFSGDEQMRGSYGGYDGPCPPWNDAVLHHYHFRVYALDVESLALTGDFTGQDVEAAMEGHVLAIGEYMGTYTLNPALRS